MAPNKTNVKSAADIFLAVFAKLVAKSEKKCLTPRPMITGTVTIVNTERAIRVIEISLFAVSPKK